MKEQNKKKDTFEVGLDKIVNESSKIIKKNSANMKHKKGFLCSAGGLY